MAAAGAQALMNQPDAHIAKSCIDGFACGLASFGCVSQSPRWDWDAFGPQGEALRTVVGDTTGGGSIDARRAYDYATMHPEIISSGLGFDWSIGYSSFSDALAFRFGSISSAARWMEKVMDNLQTAHAANNFELEKVTLTHVYWSWEHFCDLIDNRGSLLALHKTAGINFENANDFAYMNDHPVTRPMVSRRTHLFQ